MNYDETGASAVVTIIKKNRLFISNIGNSKYKKVKIYINILIL